ncbi:multidrug effflux MFS transporter [Micromonospora sp. NPDC000207]|uniref:multidrug effflux MFS transporter n=1 Tax=Micromonospora sp. NPDC000207 TaxID=3154246 RepID=UPI00332F00C3
MSTIAPAAPRVTPPTGRSGAALVVLLGLMTAVGPLSLDMYLPAFPEMTRDLEAGAAQIQISLTTCMVGMAAGQLVTGPLSDRWGRRTPALVGLAGYALLSLVCAFAPSAGALAALRFGQGFAGGIGVVVARAVVRDLYSGRDAAKYFSRLILVFGVAPVAAPAIGSLVLKVGSWRAIFVTLAVIGALLTLAVARWLPETLPATRRNTGGLTALGRTVGSLLTDRVYIGYALTQGLAFASLFAYISGSSFVVQDVFGLSMTVFAVIFGVNALGLVAMGQANVRLLDRFSPRTLLVGTLVVSSVAALTTLTGVLTGLVALVLVALFFFVSSLGMVMPNGTALALDRHAAHAGTAAALLGAIQSVIGAVAAPLVGLGGEGTALPMAVVMCVAAGLSLTVVLTLARSRRPAAG